MCDRGVSHAASRHPPQAPSPHFNLMELTHQNRRSEARAHRLKLRNPTQELTMGVRTSLMQLSCSMC